MKPARPQLSVLVVFSLALAGCPLSFEPLPVVEDASEADARIELDAGSADTAAFDAGSADTAAIDATILDAAIPDATILDAAILDAAIPDATIHDAAIPDATIPHDGGLIEDAAPRPDAGPSFPYAPRNFDPLTLSARGSLNLSRDVCIFSTDNLHLSGSCGPIAGITAVLRSNPGGTELAILPLTDLRIDLNAILRIEGHRPAVIAVFGDAAIGGRIDDTSHSATSAAGGCIGGAGSPSDPRQGIGAGGGGGAGHSTLGAPGGDGSWIITATGSPGIGGALLGATDVPLRGGCNGGAGGDGPHSGGAGGSALQISVSGAFLIDGTIGAGGGGGAGASHSGGGGGGGSGGTLILEAASLYLGSTTIIAANGGGGGAGGVTMGSGSGEDGPSSDRAAAGGVGASNGGNGGAASVGPQAGSAAVTGLGGTHDGQDQAVGGGGGGGSAGRIYLRASSGCAIDPAAVFSPARSGC